MEEIRWKLKKYKQEHLLNGYEKLEPNKQKKLLEQIQEIDFELVNSLYENSTKPEDLDKSEIEPITFVDKNKVKEHYKDYERLGEDIIKKRKICCSHNGWRSGN